MFLCSLIEELCTNEENDKTGCNFNFGHECIICYFFFFHLNYFLDRENVLKCFKELKCDGKYLFPLHMVK